MRTIFSLRQRRIITVVLTILLGAFLLYALRGLFTAFLGAIVLYVLFRPLKVYLHVKKRWPSWLSTWSILIISFVVLVIPFVAVGWMIADKTTKFLEQKDTITSIIDKVQEFVGVNLTDQELIDKVIRFLEENLAGGVSNILNGAAGTVFSIGMMYFFLYFMLYSYQKFEKGLLRYMPFKHNQTDKFAAELRNSTFANVIGQGFIAFVQGALVAVGFSLFGYPDAIFWGTISFFLSFLPVIGAPIVFVPAALIALAHGDSAKGYYLLLWGFILVTNIDNVLRYFISKYMADTHPVITIVGVIIGIPLFGILGLVFGPLLISWFLLMLHVVEESNEEGEPVNDDAL